MRCPQCEEPIEVIDVCEACARHWALTPQLRVSFRSEHSDPGPCKRGHDRYWKGTRWRCKQCDDRHRDTRNMKLRIATAAKGARR